MCDETSLQFKILELDLRSVYFSLLTAKKLSSYETCANVSFFVCE
jgi:hypothetical protein